MLDWTGGVAAELELPRHFGSSVANKSLESLSATQDGRFLFTANESALTCDGAQPDADAGSIVRILRRTMASGQNVENAYRTDPNLAPGIGGDSGVTDLAALSPTEILVLERSFVPGVGNAVTLYHANFDGDDVTDIASLGGDTRVMKKTRLTSFRDIAGASVIPKSVGAAGFPNYEGMALGPPLEGGGRALFLISDDNGGSDQVARILVLRIAD